MRHPHEERCWYCNVRLSRKNKTTDHIRPLSNGGSNSKRNKVLACRQCNTAKGCLDVEEFRLVMAYRAGCLGKTKYKFAGELGLERPLRVEIDIRLSTG